MRIKNKLFPYPTVRSDNGVYKSAKYVTKTTCLVCGDCCKLSFQVHINIPEIQGLIEKGLATHVFHLECGRTYYRRIECFQTERHEIIVSGSDIDRKLEVCPMIVALDDIGSFSCSDLSDIYQGEEISFEKGDIIAIGNIELLTIEKEQDQLKKLSSIFYVDSYPDNMD